MRAERGVEHVRIDTRFVDLDFPSGQPVEGVGW